MARTVSVALALDVSRYVTAGRQAIKVTKDFRGELSAAASRGDLDAVASQATRAGLALTGAFAGVTLVAARFDKAMSSVSAATLASAADMERLREAALQAGADTAFSATEAAAGIEQLAKAGISTADVLGGGLAGSLDLAAAGEIGVGEAAETAASAMTQFNLAGQDVTHIADLLAAGAGKAQGGIGDMSMALKQSGLVAAQTGLSIEESIGTLTAFASAGLLGSDAGTSFRTMLLRLAAPTGKAAELMHQLGISAFDSGGQFVGMAAFAGNLQTALRDMSQEQRQATLATIFGQDAIRSASILYQQGEKGIQGWIDATNDQGFAAETAARKLDNLMGDVEELTGSLETLAIESGSGANEGLRLLTQGATALVNHFGEMPPVIGGTVVVLAGVSGAAMLAFAAFVRMRGSAALALAELRAMGPAGAMAATGLQRASRMAGRAVGAFVALQLAGMATGAAFGSEFTPQLDALTEGVARFGRTGRVSGEAARALGDDFGDLSQALRTLGPEGVGPNVGNAIKKFIEWGFQLDDVQGSMGRSKEQIDAFDQALANLVQSGRTDDAATAFERMALLAEENGVSVERLKELMPTYAAALETAAAEGDETAVGMEGIGDAAAAAAEDVDALTEAFEELFGIQMDLDRAQIAYKEGLADLTEILDAGAASLSTNTEQGRENRSAVLDQVEAIADLRQANIDNNMSIDEADAKYQEQLDVIERMLIKRGFEEEAVKTLIDAYRGIPASVSTTVTTPGLDKAKKLADELKRNIDIIPRKVNIDFSMSGTAPVGSRDVAFRRGGVIAAQSGRLVPAHTVSSPTVMYGERATGQEAYIPKHGDRTRSLGIASVAAGWYGATVVPNEKAHPGYVLTEDGSWVPRNFFDTATSIAKVTMPKPGFVQAEDGSWVPRTFYDAKKRNPAENASRTGPRGPRTWDFYSSGGRSYARIFATGELIALGKMHEDQAFAHLKKIGKLDQGGWLPPGVSIVENATGQPERVLPPGAPWQWHGDFGRSMTPAQLASRRGRGSAFDAAGGGAFTGQLYLDSGELLGVVRGEIRQSQSQHDRDLLRRAGQGVGAAR